MYQNLLRPVANNQAKKLLGNYLQEGAEGSFQEISKYQNLPNAVAKCKVRKVLGNYLQEGPEGSFREMTKYPKVTSCSKS